jgi:hypothetical protein
MTKRIAIGALGGLIGSIAAGALDVAGMIGPILSMAAGAALLAWI